MEVTSKVQHEVLVLLAWQFAYLVAFLLKIYMLSSVRQELRMIKVPWKWKLKNRFLQLNTWQKLIWSSCAFKTNPPIVIYYVSWVFVGDNGPEILMACSPDFSSGWLSISQCPALLPITFKDYDKDQQCWWQEWSMSGKSKWHLLTSIRPPFPTPSRMAVRAHLAVFCHFERRPL